jgi:SHS2 domain-containing protein
MRSATAPSGAAVTQPVRPAYHLLSHTADLALEVRGASLEELFANAALGMFAQMVDLASVPRQVQQIIDVAAGDHESLLVAWLSELLFLRETRREAYCSFEVSFPAAGALHGLALGAPWQAFDRPVKAVTYHGLAITRGRAGYRATIVFDV